MSVPTIPFAKTGVKVAKIAHGLMTMTLRSSQLDDETTFATLKSSMDAVEPGVKVVLNSGEFYGMDPRTANMDLLNRFFTQNPEYKDRCIVSVKGGMKPDMSPDSSLEGLRKSVDNIIAHLGPNKHLDQYEPARVDPTIPIEEIMKSLKTLQDEGKFTYIGLSEVKGETLRKAYAVAPVVSVEVEVSPWAYTDDIKELIAVAKELGVVIWCYSPIGRGFLAGNFDADSLPADDWRRRSPRYQDEAMRINKVIVDSISKLAKKKGITNAQLCIAWVSSLGDHVMPLPGWSTAARTAENFGAGSVKLSAEEKKELEDAIAAFQAAGSRYPDHHMNYTMV